MSLLTGVADGGRGMGVGGKMGFTGGNWQGMYGGGGYMTVVEAGNMPK